MSSSQRSSQELMKKNLSDDLNYLESMPPDQPVLQELVLDNIFKNLFYQNKRHAYDLELSESDIQRLVNISIIINEASGGEDEFLCKCKSVQILSQIARRLDSQQGERVYSCLTKNFDTSLRSESEEDVAVLSAYCIALLRLDNFLWSELAEALIVKVLPLAQGAFEGDSRYSNSEGQLKNFQDLNYYCLKQQPIEESISGIFPYNYTIYIHLLLVLLKLDSGCQRTQLKQVIEQAQSSRFVTSKVFVALNLLLADMFSRDHSSQELNQLHDAMEDLLSLGDSHTGPHIAILLLNCYLLEWLYPEDREDKIHFLSILLAQLVKVGNLLYVDVFVGFIEHFSDFWDIEDAISGSEGDDRSQMSYAFRNLELELMTKLVHLDVKLNIYSTLLPYLDDVPSHKMRQFDQLTLQPISKIINRLDVLMRIDNRTQSDRRDIDDHLDCLLKFKINRSYSLDLLSEAKVVEILWYLFLEDRVSRHHNWERFSSLLLSVNCHRVHPKTWDLVTEILRQYQVDHENAGRFQKCINQIVPKLLIWDSTNFFPWIATKDMVDVIHFYCTEAINSTCDMVNILMDVLLIWPTDPSRTRIGIADHNITLKSFIMLVCESIESNSWRAEATGIDSSSHRGMSKQKDLLYALAISFSLHRTSLIEVLHTFERQTSLIDYRSWLKQNLLTWFNIATDHRNLSAVKILRHGRRQSDGIFVEFNGVYWPVGYLHSFFQYSRVVITVVTLAAIRRDLATVPRSDFQELRASMWRASSVALELFRACLLHSSNATEQRLLQDVIDRGFRLS